MPMIERAFSPNGRTNRIDYLSILLTWLLGSILVIFVAGDLRRSISPNILYFGVASIVGALAWLQICATFRRLQDLNWSWLLVLPWLPLSLWAIARAFDLALPMFVSVPLDLYGVFTCVLFLCAGGKTQAVVAAEPAREHAVFSMEAPLQAINDIAVATVPTEPLKVTDGGTVRPPSVPENAPMPIAVPTHVAIPVATAIPAANSAPGPSRSYSSPSLVAWLVAANGTERGRQYHLHAKGSMSTDSGEIEVRSVDGEPALLGYATITYDPVSVKYQIVTVGDNVRVNSQAATGSRILGAYDQLGVGDALFLFVPLCGAYYRWAT